MHQVGYGWSQWNACGALAKQGVRDAGRRNDEQSLAVEQWVLSQLRELRVGLRQACQVGQVEVGHCLGVSNTPRAARRAVVLTDIQQCFGR